MGHIMFMRKGNVHTIPKINIDIATMGISYTGNYTDNVVTMSGKQYRLLTLTSSGILNLETEVAADVWMCSGGTSGNDGNVSSSYKQYAGGGGAGGFAKQFSTQLSEGDHVAVIGVGGSKISASTSNTFNPGSHTSFDNQQTEGTFVLGNTAYKYYGTSGGTGGGGGRGGGGKGDGLSKVPFGDSAAFPNTPCAGGGGGGNRQGTFYAYGGVGGTNGADGSSGDTGSYFGGAGGAYGGGKGGNGVAQSSAKAELDGNAATFYGGGGGGGGRGGGSSGYEWSGAGGAGYQGVIYVRIPLEQ